MGLVAGSTEHQKLHAQRVVIEAVETQRGAKRGQTADRTDRNLRGVPVIGHGSGAISRTAPGGEVNFTRPAPIVYADRQLDESTRLVIQERIKAARVRLRCGPP